MTHQDFADSTECARWLHRQLTVLGAHYPSYFQYGKLDPERAELMARAYASHLGKYSKDVLAAAIKKAPGVYKDFMPTAGQLGDLCADEHRVLKSKKQADELAATRADYLKLTNSNGTDDQPLRAMSEAEMREIMEKYRD